MLVSLCLCSKLMWVCLNLLNSMHLNFALTFEFVYTMYIDNAYYVCAGTFDTGAYVYYPNFT